MADLLTDAEHLACEMAGRLWTLIDKEILAGGSTHEADRLEILAHVHAIQHAVMAQAAARAYPTTFRLLGGSVRDEAPDA